MLPGCGDLLPGYVRTDPRPKLKVPRELLDDLVRSLFTGLLEVLGQGGPGPFSPLRPRLPAPFQMGWRQHGGSRSRSLCLTVPV